MTMTKPQKTGLWIGLGSMALASVGAIWASKQAKDSEAEIIRLRDQLTELENERPPIVNVYDSIKDTSGLLKNEYANLGVAARSAEIQLEEIDISLANSLDTLRTMGGGAGAATQMALAAMRGKQQATASLEQQEAQNQKLRAQGEMELNSAKMQEAQRLQNADVQGAQWMFTQQDARKMQELNRQQALIDQERMQQQAYRTQAMTAFGSVASMGGTLAGGFIAQDKE